MVIQKNFIWKKILNNYWLFYFPLLIQTDIREEAAEALAQLTGVTNKTELWSLMEDMGLQKSYSSKEDEEEALKALAMRLDVPYRPDSFADWIGDWMDDLQSPAMYDMEDDLMVSGGQTDAALVKIMS